MSGPNSEADENIKQGLINYLEGLAGKVEPPADILTQVRNIPKRYPYVKQGVSQEEGSNSPKDTQLLLEKCAAIAGLIKAALELHHSNSMPDEALYEEICKLEYELAELLR